MDVESSNLVPVMQNVSAMATASLISQVYTTSDVFYASAPLQYQPYYFKVVRTCQQWYDGFVPTLHNASKGIMSTRLGHALCASFAQKIVGGEVGFRIGGGASDFSTLSWVSHVWSPEVGFTAFCRQAVEYGGAFGTSLIKLNRDAMGHYYPVASRLDDFTYSCDGRGNLTDLRVLVKAYQSTDNKDNGGFSYFLTEHRFYKGKVDEVPLAVGGKKYLIPLDQRIPEICYEVIRTNVSYGTQAHILNSYTPCAWDALPKNVREAINKDYGYFKVGEPQRLDFKDLGAWLVYNGGYDGSAPNMPFGVSWLRDIFVNLAEYDIYTSFKDVDVNNGCGQILTPKQQDMSDIHTSITGGISTSPQTPIGGEMYASHPREIQVAPGEEPQKPVCNQFSLRADEWVTLINDELRTIATKLNMSPSLISPSLAITGSQSKTATETEAEDTNSDEWITAQRMNLTDPFDKMIECLLSAVGKVGNVIVKFGNVGLRSKTKALTYCILATQNHFMTRAEAIRELHPEMDEEQVQAKIAECNAEAEADRASGATFPGINGQLLV